MSRGTAVPPPPPVQSPAQRRSVQCETFIEDQLRKTRRQVKGVELASQLLTLVIGAMAYLFVAALLDHWLVPGGLGFWGRLVLMAGLVGGAGWFFAVRVLPLLVHRINPLFAARTIEDSRPSLKNSLTNFLLLRRSRGELPAAIYAALEDRAASDLAGVPVESVVDRTHALRLGYVLAGVLAVCCLYLLVSPKSPLVSAGRVIWPWADIRPPTRVTIAKVVPGDEEDPAVVSRGDPVAVSAEVRGLRDGEQVTFYYTTADGQSVDEAIPMTPSGEGSFRYNLPQEGFVARQDVEYRLAAGDCTTRRYKIHVEVAPAIVVDGVDYDYPAYTRIPDATIADLGDVRAVEGTRVTVRATANLDIASAEVDLDCDGRRGLDMQTQGRSARRQFTLRMREDDPSRAEHDSYQLRFTDAEGRRNRRPIRYRIQVIPDLAPRVELAVESHAPLPDEILLPAGGTLELKVRAEDPDFGLRRVAVRAACGDRDLAIPPMLELGPTSRGTAPHQGPLEAGYHFDSARLGLKAGDVVSYWAEADDNKEPRANHAETERRRIVIVAPNDRAHAQNQPKEGPRRPDPEKPQPKPSPERPQAKPGEHDTPPGEEPKKPEEKPGEKPAEKPPEQGQQPDKQQPKDQGQSPKEQPQKQGEAGQQGQPQQGQSKKGQPQQGEGGQKKKGEDQKGDQQGQSQEGQPSQDGQQGQEQRRVDPGSNAPEAFRQILEDEREQEKQKGQQPKPGDKSPDQKQPGGEPKPGEHPDQGEAKPKPGQGEQGEAKPKPGQGEQGEAKPKPGPGEQGEAKPKPGPGEQGEAKPKPGPGEQPKQGEPGAGSAEKSQPGEGAQSRGTGEPEKPKEQTGQPGAKTPEGSKGGDTEQTKGQPGAGKPPSESSGTPSPQGKNSPRDKKKAGDPSQDQGNQEDGKSPSISPHNSDSQGDTAGDHSGGGKEGGGQRSKQPGAGAAGSHSEADQGSGKGKQQGEGETGTKGGNQTESKRPTGSHGTKPEGSGAEGRQKPGPAGQGQKPSQGKGDASGGRKAPPGQPGGQPEGQSNERPNAHGTGNPTTGGRPGKAPDGPPPPPQKLTGDDPNLDYARKATDLALEHLRNQMTKEDSELLKKLQWTRQDAEKFLKGWLERKKRAAEAGPQGEAARKQLDEELRNLGLEPRGVELPGGGIKADQLQKLHEGRDFRPPPEWAEQFKAFQMGISGQKDR